MRESGWKLKVPGFRAFYMAVETETANLRLLRGWWLVSCSQVISCFADSAPAGQIHPLPFGLPPSLRGHLLTGILNIQDNR